jgi:hypothetical protein
MKKRMIKAAKSEMKLRGLSQKVAVWMAALRLLWELAASCWSPHLPVYRMGRRF